MSSTAKDAATKDMNKDKRKSVQAAVNAVPVTTKLAGLPLEELKYLRAEMRLG